MAASAEVNVRALYQHFGSKKKLYEAVFGDSIAKKHDKVLAAIDAIARDPEGAGELLPALHQSLADSLSFVRLVTWDALSADQDEPGKVVASEARAAMYAKEIALLEEAQQAGRLSRSLEPDLLLVALMSLAIFPSAVRPLTQLITGESPESPEFRKRYDSFLAEIGRTILVPGRDVGVAPVDDPSAGLHRVLRQGARALARSGLVTAFGHCSVRIDESAFLVTPSMPLGQITHECGIEVPVVGALPSGVAGEVRVHQAIYRRRPDVNGVVRVLPPAVRALSVLGHTARPLDGPGSYFAPGPALWPEPQLIRNDEAAGAVADVLADSSAVVLRGNGAVIAAESLPRAVILARFLEDASAVDLATKSTGEPAIELTREEASARATWEGGIEDRMWSYLTQDDPEPSGPVAVAEDATGA